MPESQRPTTGRVPVRRPFEPQGRRGTPVPRERLDELLLELILVDTVARLRPERGPIAERLIERVFAPADYLRVIEYYDELSGDDDDDSQLVPIWFLRAACKDSRWKTKMLRYFNHVVGLGQPLADEGIAELARLADAMGARPECQVLCVALYDKDPFAE